MFHLQWNHQLTDSYLPCASHALMCANIEYGFICRPLIRVHYIQCKYVALSCFTYGMFSGNKRSLLLWLHKDLPIVTSHFEKIITIHRWNVDIRIPIIFFDFLKLFSPRLQYILRYCFKKMNINIVWCRFVEPQNAEILFIKRHIGFEI